MKAIRFILSVPRDLPAAGPIGLAWADRSGKANAAGTTLWVDKDVPLIEIGDRGYIVGVLFSRRSAARLFRLPDETPTDVDALAAWLVRECWGGYAAMLVCPDTSSINMIADPSGLCPVYRTQTASHIVIATHPALFSKVGDVSLSASWSALHCFLARPELRQRETCLTGVTELAPGELVSVSGLSQRMPRRLWRPENFMPDGGRIDFEEAAEGLRDVAQMVCSAWAKVFGPVLVAASGGVDSSLICAALATVDAQFACATVATSDPSGDERRFVKLLADHLGVHSVAAIYDPCTIDPTRAISTGLARPSRKPFMAALDAALFAAAAEVGAKTVFDGNGGDNLFCFLHSAAPVVDRLRCEGLGRGTGSTLRDMCLVTGCDMPTMLRAAGRRLMRRDAVPSWSADLRLLSPATQFPDRMEPLLPWLHTPVGLHGGKRDHLALIMHSQLHIHGIADCGLPRFSPLASQLLIEYCLKVPTWLWCQGGTNRALARQAFAADLPREILKRTSKAGPDSFIHQCFHRHRESIRELIMDGLLASHGVIDRDAVDDAIQAGVRLDGETILRLLDLAEAESWARSWNG